MSEQQDEGLAGWIEDLRAEYWNRLREPDEPDGRAGTPHVIFDLAGRRFSVEARLCRGVVRSPRVARLPGVPAHILGVAGIRGEVVSVTDPAVLLGVPGERENGPGYLLIIASGKWKAALWVDQVRDVALLREHELLPVDAPWQRAPAGVVVGQKTDGQPPLLVLDGLRYLEASAVNAGGGPPRARSPERASDAQSGARATEADIADSAWQNRRAQKGEEGVIP